MVLGVIIGTILMVTIWAIGNGLTSVGRIRETAGAYADSVVPKIVGEWNAKELAAQAAPELKENADEAAMEGMMNDLRAKLGKPKKIEKAQIGDFASPSRRNDSGPFIVVNVVVPAEFEKGKATVELKLVRREGQWRIGNFFVQGSP